MKIKTSELTGAALDWAVAKCEGPNSVAACYYDEDDLPMCRDEAQHMEWQPSTNWAQGGPIIEREEIDLNCYESPTSGVGWWSAEITGTEARAKGTKPLIAAMRCYVASRLGDTIDIPTTVQD
jgi:hypothetical protein